MVILFIYGLYRKRLFFRGVSKNVFAYRPLLPYQNQAYCHQAVPRRSGSVHYNPGRSLSIAAHRINLVLPLCWLPSTPPDCRKISGKQIALEVWDSLERLSERQNRWRRLLPFRESYGNDLPNQSRSWVRRALNK